MNLGLSIIMWSCYAYTGLAVYAVGKLRGKCQRKLVWFYLLLDWVINGLDSLNVMLNNAWSGQLINIIAYDLNFDDKGSFSF